MNEKIANYISEFIDETSLAFLLDGKHEVKKYASYWLSDIYHFAESLYCHTLFNVSHNEISHDLNPNGNAIVEVIADTIFEALKHFKIFSYFFEIDYKHLRELVMSMNVYVETYFSVSPTNFEQSKEMMSCLYGVPIIRPLPLSTFPIFSYIDDGFTPDVIEYEGLKRSLDSIKNIFTLSYAMTDRSNYQSHAKQILSGFDIPLNRNVEIILTDDYVQLYFYLNGVERQRHIRKQVSFGIYEANYCGLGLIDTLKVFFSETINRVIGKQKVKNSDDEASYGILPMKDQAVHGLKIDLGRVDAIKRLKAKEAQSINMIKETLFMGEKPVTSTSYGVDSVLVQYLVKKVYPEIDVYHGKTGLDFPEIYEVEKQLIEREIIKTDRLFYGKNKTSYWSLVDEYGFNFERKGKRDNNSETKSVNRSEKCCMELKHIPFINAIKENEWDINFAGLRADESRVRELAAKRDGPIYFAKSWNLYRVNPIIFWSDNDVWEYTRQNRIPYASIYDMSLYNDDGDVIFKPRIGCWACMLSAKYGYLKWLKAFKPLLYQHIMIERGLLKLLYAKKLGYEVAVNDLGKESVEAELEGYDPDYLLSFLEQRPCFFDEQIVNF